MTYVNAPIAMTFSDRELFTYRIISGVARVKLESKILKIYPPTTEIFLEACEIYNDSMHEYYSRGVKDEEETLPH